MKKTILFLFIIIIFKAEAQTVSALEISQKADSLYEIGDYSSALSTYKKIGSDPKVEEKIAKTYQALGNTPKAIQYYEKSISKGTENIPTKFDFAKLLTQSSKYKMADSIFEKLSEQFPENPNFIYQRGLIKEAQNDSTALEYYRQVYVMDTNNINAIYKIGRNYTENRKFEKAEPFIIKGLSVDKKSVRFLTLRALKQFYTKDCHGAISTYNTLANLGENYIHLYENLASCYSYTNQFGKALGQYKILFENFDDKNPKWHAEVALLYRNLKDYKNAEHHINIAIGLQEAPLSQSYMELARIYKQQNDPKNEMEALQSALLNNPDNEAALYKLAVAADNYFADKKLILQYYENYLKKYSESGRMRELAKQRVKDLKKELFFTSH